MKKAPANNTAGESGDELRPEYALDYDAAKPNRFAARVDPTCVLVPLDPHVARIFTTPEAVNNALRNVINAMPSTPYQ